MVACSGALQLLETYETGGHPANPKKQKMLSNARCARDDLKEIVTGILSHAREAGQYSLSPLDVNAVIEDEIAFFDMIPDF